MTVTVRFTKLARSEFLEATDWYAAQRLDLASDFEDEFDAAITRITQTPTLYAVFHHGVRKAPLRRFPYAIFYRPGPDAIAVVACFHQHRDPRRLQRRL